MRDWLYVMDHAAAIDLIFHQGEPGRTYNIGGFNEWKNIDLITLLCQIMDQKTGTSRRHFSRTDHLCEGPGRT